MKINTIGLLQCGPTPNRRPGSLLGLALVLLLTSLLAGCQFGRQARPTPTPFLLFQTDGTPTAPESDYVVQEGDVVLYEKFVGKIEMDVEEDLFFGRAGRVAEVHVQSGDSVEEGTLIAELDDTFLAIDLEITQLTLKQSQKSYRRAVENLDYSLQEAEMNLAIAQIRYENLLEQVKANPKSIEPISLLVQQNQVQIAELRLDRVRRDIEDIDSIGVQLSELRLQRMEESVAGSKLIAPFAGEVRFTRLYEDGRPQSVSAYQTVAQIVDPTTLKVEANLVPRQLEKLAEGLRVEMVRQTRPDQVITGEIRDLPQPFGNGVSPLVQISIDDPSKYVGLRPGSSVQVQVEVDRKEGVAWLPREAVSGFGESYTVLVQDGNSTREVSIEVGMQTDEQVEILGGIEVGDVVERR